MEVGLAIFGGVAAGCTLSAELLRLSRSLRKVIKSIRYARREISKVADEMNMFAELYDIFLDTCSNISVYDTHAFFSPECLIAWTRSATRGIRKLLRKVRALASGQKYEFSLVEKVTAHVRWYFSRGSVTCLRASLSVARESMAGLTNIRYIQKLHEQLIFLSTAVRDGKRQALEEELGMTVEERNKELELCIQNRRDIRHEIDQRLQKAKEKVMVHQDKSQDCDFIPRVKELFDFTESVREYAEEVLPPIRSGRGIHNLNQLSEPKPNPRRAVSKTPKTSLGNTSIVSEPSKADIDSLRHSAKTPTTLEGSWNSSDIIIEFPSISTEAGTHSSNCATSIGRYYNTSFSSIPSASSISASSKGKKPVLASKNTHSKNTHSKNTHSKNTHSKNTNSKNTNSYNTHSNSRAREYINDPAGNILSPPIVKDRSILTNSNMIAGKRDGKIRLLKFGPMEPLAAPQDTPKITVTHERDIGPSKDEAEDFNATGNGGNDSESEALENDLPAGPSPFHPVAGFEGKYPRGWHRRHDRSQSP